MFNEPLADLMKVLASLVDSSNRILVPGFQALVRPNTLEPALERLAASSEFSLDGYRAALGIPRLVRSILTLLSPEGGLPCLYLLPLCFTFCASCTLHVTPADHDMKLATACSRWVCAVE